MAFPDARPGGYDPDLVWDEESKAWIAVSAASTAALGGGKYHEQLVVVGNMKIYYGDL